MRNGERSLLAFAGCGFGLLVFLLGSPLLSSSLYQNSRHDLPTLLLVLLLLFLAALFASYWPARRAMRVDPMVLLRSISNIFHDGWIICTKQYVEILPIRTIDFSDPAEKSRHDRMVKLADSTLGLQKQLGTSKSAAQKGILQRQIKATDRQIDQLVYQLYRLTDEEMALIEDRENPQSVG